MMYICQSRWAKYKEMERNEWVEWVRSQATYSQSISACPKTGGMFLTLGSYLITPTIQNMAMNFALKRLSHGILSQAVASSIPSVFSSLVSMPFDYLGLKGLTKQNEDRLLDLDMRNYAKYGKEISMTEGFFKRISESNQVMMILLASVLALYFQYKGMITMQEETSRYQSVGSHIDVLQEQDMPSTAFSIWLKKSVFSKYREASFYENKIGDDRAPSTLFDKSTLDRKQYDSVRLVYNTLVGLNHTLFYCLGGKSEDPVHEITHWTKILVYWEILARLLKQNGIGPMQIASQMFVHDLWSKKKS